MRSDSDCLRSARRCLGTARSSVAGFGCMHTAVFHNTPLSSIDSNVRRFWLFSVCNFSRSARLGSRFRASGLRVTVWIIDSTDAFFPCVSNDG